MCSYPREYISRGAGVFLLCLCWFELGLIAFGNTAVHAHITYDLKSFLRLSLSLRSPICFFTYLHHSSLFLPPLQRGLFVGPRDRRRLARHKTSLRGSNIRPDLWSNSTNTHSPRRAVSQHASTCTESQTFHSVSHSVSSVVVFFYLTSFHSPFPQVLPLSLCQLMSSKMTSPPRPLSDMAVTNHQAFLH